MIRIDVEVEVTEWFIRTRNDYGGLPIPLEVQIAELLWRKAMKQTGVEMSLDDFKKLPATITKRGPHYAEIVTFRVCANLPEVDVDSKKEIERMKEELSWH